MDGIQCCAQLIEEFGAILNRQVEHLLEED